MFHLLAHIGGFMRFMNILFKLAGNKTKKWFDDVLVGNLYSYQKRAAEKKEAASKGTQE